MTPWNLACPDWRERLATGQSLVPTLPLYPSGDRAVAIFNKLRLFDVTGTPTMAEAGADWFRDAVRALFGSYDPATRQRFIQELFLLVPKKNNKTTGGALLMLTALLMNERPRAPFLMTAPVQKTAEDAFNALAGAIGLDPVLDAKFHVRDHLKTIVHRETKAVLQIITFDPEVVTGKKVAGALIDEYHVLGKMAKASRSMIQLRGGMQPFPEAFLAIITTQSDDAPAGVFKDELQKARDIRDGKRQAPTLPILYEFDTETQQAADQPWTDPGRWHEVNPNIGRSVHLPKLVEAFEDAKIKGEGELRTWASQHLNIEIGLALHANRWAGADHWQSCGGPKITLESLLQRAEVVTLGIDGGGLEDLLALSAIGREKGTGIWLHWCKAWAHPSVLKRRKSEEARFRDFAKDGDLCLVEQIGDDVREVADIAKEVRASGRLYKIGVDPLCIGPILKALMDAGIPEEQIVGIPQGYQLTKAIKTTERALAEGRILHSSCPMMAWSVGNAKVEAKGNAIVITKQAAGFAKIDPLLATFDGIALMQENPPAQTEKFRMLVLG